MPAAEQAAARLSTALEVSMQSRFRSNMGQFAQSCAAVAIVHPVA
jgi:hypothetical protein